MSTAQGAPAGGAGSVETLLAILHPLLVEYETEVLRHTPVQVSEQAPLWMRRNPDCRCGFRPTTQFGTGAAMHAAGKRRAARKRCLDAAAVLLSTYSAYDAAAEVLASELRKEVAGKR